MSHWAGVFYLPAFFTHQTAVSNTCPRGTRRCWCRLIPYQPFSWGVDRREQGKMGCCAPCAGWVPQLWRSVLKKAVESPKFLRVWCLFFFSAFRVFHLLFVTQKEKKQFQGLRTHRKARQLESWLRVQLLLWTSCWCPQKLPKSRWMDGKMQKLQCFCCFFLRVWNKNTIWYWLEDRTMVSWFQDRLEHCKQRPKQNQRRHISLPP